MKYIQLKPGSYPYIHILLKLRKEGSGGYWDDDFFMTEINYEFDRGSHLGKAYVNWWPWVTEDFWLSSVGSRRDDVPCIRPFYKSNRKWGVSNG